jgi:hypothetical protein
MLIKKRRWLQVLHCAIENNIDGRRAEAEGAVSRPRALRDIHALQDLSLLKAP